MGRLPSEKTFLSDIVHFLRCCSGSKDVHGGEHYLQPLTSLHRPSNTAADEFIEQSALAREKLWRRLGSLEPLVLSHAGSTAHHHGDGFLSSAPRWPSARQNFRVIKRTNGNIMIVTDGLSDPFDDILASEGNVNGFGLEFYVELPEEEMGPDLRDVKRSWQFQLLYTVAQLAAGHGGIRSIIDDMTLLSTEAEGVVEGMPEEGRKRYATPASRVGALLGLTDSRHAYAADYIPDTIEDMPLTDVKFVNIKLITTAELGLITERGAEGRRKLSDLLQGDGRLVSSLRRPSVL